MTNSPLGRSIGLNGVMLFVIAAAAAGAVVIAFAAGFYTLGTAGLVFFGVAGGLGYRAWRARRPPISD